MTASELLRQARRRARLSQRELATLAHTSQSAVAAIESGSKQPTVETLTRLLAAAGAGLALVESDEAVLMRRGRHLTEVLGLAEALPFRRSRELRFPRVPS